MKRETQDTPLKIPYTNHTRKPKKKKKTNEAKYNRYLQYCTRCQNACLRSKRSATYFTLISYDFQNENKRRSAQIKRTPSKYQTTLLTKVYNFARYRHRLTDREPKQPNTDRPIDRSTEVERR